MKNTHPCGNVIILYIILLIMTSCNYTNYDMIEETIPDEGEEIIIQEVQTMELQAIKEYDKYIESGGRIYGIKGDKLEEIILKDTDDVIVHHEIFFVLDNATYISVMVMEPSEPDGEPSGKEYYFSQTGFLIQEELKNEFPRTPDSEHINYKDDGLFEIITFPYEIDGEMADTSRVIRGGVSEGYLKIDGCMRDFNGIWFSVPGSIATRLKGVYFWGNEGVKNRVLTEGRIW